MEDDEEGKVGAAAAPEGAVEVDLELEHAIGFAGGVRDAIGAFADGDTVAYPAGSCVGAWRAGRGWRVEGRGEIRGTEGRGVQWWARRAIRTVRCSCAATATP